MGALAAIAIAILVLWWALSRRYRRQRADVEHAPPEYIPQPRQRNDRAYRPAARPSTAVDSVPLAPYGREVLDGMSKRAISAATLDVAYRDSRDTPTWRRIDVTGTSEYGEYKYLEAWCHLRAAPRSFRVDRIAEIVRPVTGEVFANISDFVISFARETLAPGAEQNSVMSRARTGLVPLIWIARSDYELSDAEMDRLVEYVAARNRLSGARYENADWNRVLARRWIEAQNPTLENARGALSGMTKDGRERDLVARFASQLLDDGGDEKGVVRRMKTLGLS